MGKSQYAAKVFAFSTLIFSFQISAFAQSDSIFRVDAGTRITLRMGDGISSKASDVDDTFVATVAEPVMKRGRVMIGEGVSLTGLITKVERSGTGNRNGRIDFRMVRLRLADGTELRIDAVPVEKFEGERSGLLNVLGIAGGVAVGALIGSAADTGNGALIGAGVGGGAATGIALLRKGEDIVIPDGEKFQVELKSDIVLPVTDY